MAEIRIDHLHKRFGDFVAVEDSTFTVDDGEFFVMLGPSGCGKTTTLRMIAGLELPTSGEVRLDGDDVTFHRASQRDIAFMFQLFALYPHMNVRRNIGFPLKCQGMPAAEIRSRVADAAALLRISDLLDQPVSRLSGGDRQRVALGRAIVRDPKAFLMDEPLGALDSEFRELMCGELRTLHDNMNATTVYVTHDQIEAMAMADRIMVMNHGVIEQLATPRQIYDRPATMFVANFVGSPAMNFLPVQGTVAPGQTAVAVSGTDIRVPATQEAAPGEAMLGFRPEHIRLSDDAGLRGTVFGSEYLGTTQIVTINTQVGQVKARVSAQTPVRTGENIGLDLLPDRLIVFAADDGRALRSEFLDG